MAPVKAHLRMWGEQFADLSAYFRLETGSLLTLTGASGSGETWSSLIGKPDRNL